MSNILENDAELCRNSIRFLHDVSILPEINVPALKSIYSTQRRLMELRKSILLPSSFTRTSVTCQRCLINLNEGPANYRVVPAKKQTVFAKKILAKQKSGKPLTKYQQKYLEGVKHFCGNHLGITCKFCKNEALIRMEKPKKLLRQKVKISIKPKKKKKKDKFCGLKQDVVLSLSSQNKKKKLDNNANESNIKKKRKKSKLENTEVMSSSLTHQNMRSLYDSNETVYKRPKMKIKKSKEIEILDTSKENLKKSKHKLKKKKQSLNKLSEILNKSNNAVKNPISSLKQFLQGL